jgi:UPF0042 nucleotide-binding protein
VSGLSGSGKSTAMAALEDMSFYCVDNLPVQLIEQFLHLCTQATPPIEKIGLAFSASCRLRSKRCGARGRGSR